jgi:hypothetical protein
MVAAVTLAPLTVACSSDDKPAAVSAASSATASADRAGACLPVPAKAPDLTWLPADLPLPPGSFATQDLEVGAPPPSLPESETHRGLIAVHASVEEFSSFIKTEWGSRGWTFGKGDAEQGEAEGGYRKGELGGVYRVRDVFCDPTFSELLLVYGPGATADSVCRLQRLFVVTL